jgi:hypothetical protein
MRRNGLSSLKGWCRVAPVFALVTGGVVLFGAKPVSAATSVTALYEMNESSGASVMRDSGPYGNDGVIGSDIVAGATYGGATGYRWSTMSPTAPPAKPGRIAYVNSTSAHNPDNGDFAVEFRYRTTKSYGNVVQKGQSAATGGYFKFEQPFGKMTCLFKDENGLQRAVQSPVATKDGEWHVIRCELSDWGIRLYVDGTLVVSRQTSMGRIANTKRLSIGGKSDCDQINVTCDYFNGDIDYVKIEKGGSTPPPPPPTSVDCTVSWSGSTATLTWNATDGRDIVRRNGSWLATPPSGAGTYVDQNAPSGASYLIRTWTSAGSADHPCTGSDPPPPPPPPPPGSGCTFVVDGSTTTLTWDPLGGTDVVRRDGRWLATVGPDVGTYADVNAPEGADYLIRAWTGAGSVDTECVAAPT